MRRLLSLLAMMAVALAAVGCPPTDYGTRCRFEGDTTTTCGTCIARACQAVVDECCGSFGCKERLSTLDRCSRGQGCDSLFANTVYLEDLSQCIKASCPSECP